MKRNSVVLAVALAFVIGLVVWYGSLKEKDAGAPGSSAPSSGETVSGKTSGDAPSAPASAEKAGSAEAPSPQASDATPGKGTEPTPAQPQAKPSVQASATPSVAGSKPAVPADLEDEGDIPMQKKAEIPVTPAGVKSAKLWWVASDLRELPNAPGGGRSFEVGIPEGSKATRWKNRAGPKTGDGVRVKGSANGTFVPGYATPSGEFDAVLICAPDAKNCMNSQASQIKIGPDVNHADHWLSGADKTGKSAKGGSSFTALFVAARASANGNPLMEHQNGDAGSTKGPFLGWIGTDLVASIHGSQGAVGVSAVATPSAWTGKVAPQIYTVRFDRKKGKLALFVVGEKSEAVSLDLQPGDGPDNDEYAGIAMGSKSPGSGATTYVFEGATFSRALEDREICAIHKEWSTKYGLKTSAIKPCP